MALRASVVEGLAGAALVDALVPELARQCRASPAVAAEVAHRFDEWSGTEAALLAVMLYRELCGDAPIHDLKPGVLTFYRALREESLP